MPEKDTYEAKAANFLKSQLKLQGITYKELVEKLDAVGVVEKEVNVRNKLARGKFSAAFLLACLDAIEVTDLRL